MKHTQAAITSVHGEATFLPALLSPGLNFHRGHREGLAAHFHFMAHRFARAVPIVLLVFGLAAILLLTVPTEDVQGAPGFMVRPRLGYFGSSVYQGAEYLG